MLKLLSLLLTARKPLACRIYPPGVNVPHSELEAGDVLVVVIELS
ncbi:hypothetical protein [Vulcanococcus sp.]